MADTKVVEQDFVLRVLQREENKKYHVMKFRASLNQDYSMWTGSRMVRENNQKIVQSNVPQDDDPKLGMKGHERGNEAEKAWHRPEKVRPKRPVVAHEVEW